MFEDTLSTLPLTALIKLLDGFDSAMRDCADNTDKLNLFKYRLKIIKEMERKS